MTEHKQKKANARRKKYQKKMNIVRNNSKYMYALDGSGKKDRRLNHKGITF